MMACGPTGIWGDSGHGPGKARRGLATGARKACPKPSPVAINPVPPAGWPALRRTCECLSSFSSRDKVTPLIIAGRPRAGTRYLTDVLNRFEDVAIQSEIPNPVMAAIHRFFRDTDNYYRGAGDSEERGERGPGELAAWQSKKTSLMFALWIGGAQAKPKRARQAAALFRL